MGHMQTLDAQLAELERELDELRTKIKAADAEAAKRPKLVRNDFVHRGPDDIMPLRNRMQVVELKIARLRSKRWWGRIPGGTTT